MNEPQLQYDCEHGVRVWYDMHRIGFWAQHDNNPESRIFLADDRIASARSRLFGYRVVRRWLNRVHTYEAAKLERHLQRIAG